MKLTAAITMLDKQHKRSLDFVQSFLDRKSTRLNSSHSQISYAVFCLKKKKYFCPPFSEYLHLLAAILLFLVVDQFTATSYLTPIHVSTDVHMDTHVLLLSPLHDARHA